SLATMARPAIGYGLRYDYGIFRQEIRAGSQVEHPDRWLSRPDPWEVSRPNETVEVPLGCRFESRGGEISVLRGQSSSLLGVPHDRPVVGYGGRAGHHPPPCRGPAPPRSPLGPVIPAAPPSPRRPS